MIPDAVERGVPRAEASAGGRLRVCVIGAGIVGACAAIELLRDGHTVTLVEPGEPGGEQAASYGNGAWLSPASVVPMSTPGLWKKVPQFLLDPSGPLVIRWWAWPILFPWLIRFMRSGYSIARVQATARALSALLHDAPQQHGRLAGEAGVADLIVCSGLLYAYPDRAAFEADALAWRLRRENGVQWTELEGACLRERAPDLGPAYRLGIHVPAGAYCLDPGAYVAALVRHAVASGASLHRVRATGFGFAAGRLAQVQTDGGALPCDRAVIAAGIASSSLARQAGDRIPLASERGYHIVVPRPGVRLDVPVMAADGKIALTGTRNGLRIAGQVELASVQAAPDWRRVDILLHHGRRVVPALGQRADLNDGARWLGHRPSTPDGLPVVGQASVHHDIVHAFGHGHSGLVAGPATARLVADIILERKPAIDLIPYRPERFRWP